jgi:formylglycine-generating enzyme required for sulfatase activity
VAGGIAVVVATIVVVAWQMVSRRRAETEHEIARYVGDATEATGAARSQAAEARALRARAFAAFDKMEKDGGEDLWRRARALLPGVDAQYDQAERSLEAAFMLDQSRREQRARLADIRYEHLLFAEDFRLGTKVTVLEERLATIDTDGSKRRAFTAPGTVVVRTTPVASRLLLERYDRDPASGRRDAKTIELLPAGESTRTLPPGSYRLEIEGPGLAHMFYPFEVPRAERVVVDLKVPKAAAIPRGFAYVAPGRFWFGDADELLRTEFFDTVPIHVRDTDGFLIGENETTYGEWIAFLKALPAPERSKHAPNISSALRGSLSLTEDAGGWRLTFQPGNKRYTAAAGEPIVYSGRSERARQDWLRFPVGGVSRGDAKRYAEWLDATGAVPGARLCTEVEWERAARGADDRLFPHGDDLLPGDANFDMTYGRVDSAYGPDVVGSHPLSRSPFGVEDMTGNVFELMTSSLNADAFVIRGGAYYYKPVSCRSTNREPIAPTFRDVVAGIRICTSKWGDGIDVAK